MTSCTNFCTSSDHFVSTFVRQPNGLECTQIVRSAPKRQFRVQWGGSGAFVAENSDANIFTSSARFAPSFVRQPNGPECTQMVLNTPKRQFRVEWVGSGAFVTKNSDTTSWHERTSSARFAPIFVRHPNGSECTQWYETHQNISLGANGVDRVRSLQKIPTRLRGTNFCTNSACFAPSFVRQPNGPKRIQIVRNTQNSTR